MLVITVSDLILYQSRRV